jgi:hypothetical protein
MARPMRYRHSKSCLAILAVVVMHSLVHANALALPINGITLGGSEKGLYLGVDSALGPRDLIEIGGFYVDATVANIDIGLSESIPITVTGAGLRLAYSRFLFNTVKKSGPFVQAGLSAGNLSASSQVNLDKLDYSTNSGTIISCSSCGYLKAKTTNPDISLIPSVGFGWQLSLGSRTLLRAVAGIQYYDVPNAEWSASGSLPKFARSEIKSAIKSLNSDINSTSDIYPTASLSLTYAF